jgi:uncharacterized membrane protein YkoI
MQPFGNPPVDFQTATLELISRSWRDSTKLKLHNKGEFMARYSKSAGKDVKRAVKRKKKGKLKKGNGGKGGAVKSRKQAIAIGLSEARKKGKKVPKKTKKTKRKTAKKKS